MPHEDAIEDEHAHEVLVPAHDRHEAVDLRAAEPLPQPLAGGEDVEARDEPEVDDGVEELAVHRVVVVLDAGKAGEHHALEPLVADRLELADPALGGPHRGLPEPDEAVGVGLAELDQPPVVRLHARLLEIEVGDVANLHADRRIQHLRGDSVPVLSLDAGVRLPAAAVELLELRAPRGELLGGLARRGDEGEGDALLAPLDTEHVAPLLVVHHDRRAVAELRVDATDVAVGRLDDMAVGGDDGLRHARAVHVRAAGDYSKMVAWRVRPPDRPPATTDVDLGWLTRVFDRNAELGSEWGFGFG